MRGMIILLHNKLNNILSNFIYSIYSVLRNIQITIMSSISSALCNLTLDEEDLKKLEDLDPNQSNGFKSIIRTSIPIKIIYTNELGDEFSDTQDLYLQILVRMIKGSQLQRHTSVLDQIQVYLTSETDLYLNFVSNCNQETFKSICSKNGLNIQFNDFPNVLINMLKNCSSSPQSVNEIQLNLSYEGTGKLQIFQKTQYKKLQLIELFFTRSTVQKTHQSIIYRYNFQKSKLALIEKSIESIYDILSEKNVPLLQFIQSSVGINE